MVVDGFHWLNPLSAHFKPLLPPSLSGRKYTQIFSCNIHLPPWYSGQHRQRSAASFVIHRHVFLWYSTCAGSLTCVSSCMAWRQGALFAATAGAFSNPRGHHADSKQYTCLWREKRYQRKYTEALVRLPLPERTDLYTSLLIHPQPPSGSDSDGCTVVQSRHIQCHRCRHIRSRSSH